MRVLTEPQSVGRSSHPPHEMPVKTSSRRVLFINCPFGRFFDDLCTYGDDIGFRFERIAFDAGDYFEASPGRRHLYRSSRRTWEDFIRDRLKAGRYDLMIVYNDALPFNQAAIACAEETGLPWLTLENGYLRPHWVTLEQGGVNGNSPQLTIPLETNHSTDQSRLEDDILFDHRMAHHVASTMRHFTIAILGSPVFPYRPRYYGTSVMRQAIGYFSEFVRGIDRSERRFLEHLTTDRSSVMGRRFLCPLQKPGDTQLRVHSDISTNNALLEIVLPSFARHAPRDAVLVVKRHPYDYGIEGTKSLFHRMVREFGIEDRCFFVEKTKMYKVMDWADALVVNNSSTGLEGLRKGLPVKALGRAIYNRPGITFEDRLDDFWTHTDTPNQERVACLVGMLRRTSQLNGGFYSPEARAILFPHLIEKLRNTLHTDSHRGHSLDGDRFPAPLQRTAQPGTLGTGSAIKPMLRVASTHASPHATRDARRRRASR